MPVMLIKTRRLKRTSTNPLCDMQQLPYQFRTRLVSPHKLALAPSPVTVANASLLSAELRYAATRSSSRVLRRSTNWTAVQRPRWDRGKVRISDNARGMTDGAFWRICDRVVFARQAAAYVAVDALAIRSSGGGVVSCRKWQRAALKARLSISALNEDAWLRLAGLRHESAMPPIWRMYETAMTLNAELTEGIYCGLDLLTAGGANA